MKQNRSSRRRLENAVAGAARSPPSRFSHPMHDLPTDGVVTLFAAGNEGEENAMSMEDQQ